ncbi:MAG: peptidylprolyl isomerase [Acidobacteria bacterium]|nr:peptidylprolyl isomerase [Acidobacteriota bacterium]
MKQKAFATVVAMAVTAAVLAAQTPARAPIRPPASAPAPTATQAAPGDVAAPPADAVTSASGLASRTITPGTSEEKPAATDVVTVHYTGWTPDGTMFDSSRSRGAPSMFPLNRSLVGWRECVQLMTIGETRRCWLPQKLAYNGQAGRPTGTVVFDIELIDTRRAPAVAPPDVAEAPEDVKRTASGLAYRVLKPGTGARRPATWDRVTVHYTGWTTDGKMFDSSVARGMPATLALDNVIRGWTEGMQLMVEGERTRFWIPQNLAYKGEPGSPRGMLVFDIDLIKIE